MALDSATDECSDMIADERVWLNRGKKGVGASAVRSQTNQQQQQYGIENETGRGRSNGTAGGGRSRTAIERIMMEEKRLQLLREKERLISSSRNTGDETTSLSTNASSRYIRNNSYLNANPTLNALANGLVS